MAVSDVALLDRREIEAGIVAPLLQAFEGELGEARAIETAAAVIRRLAREAGAAAAARLGRNDLFALAEVVRTMWSAASALDVVVTEETGTVLAFDVRRCVYAETYERMGVRRYGPCLSCGRDAAFAEGFNPRIRMCRTMTIMEGAPRCDFRFTLEDA